MAVLAHDVYTDQPNVGPYVIFPTHAYQVLSNFVHILGVSVLSYCFARRTENDRFSCWKWWTNLTWARLLIILIFFDSWVFLAFSGILVNGVGLSYSLPVCSLGIFGCILLYAGSKGLTYLFLVERVWVVYSAGKPVARRHSRIYKGCAIIVFGYSAIIILMIIGRYADIRDDGVCVIGLHSLATIPLLAYDLLINILLTSMFLWFLCREQKITDRLRHLARRTAFAACVALTISCVNILILALLEGKQLGWVCLSSCGADVTVNALALFWVTGATRERHWHGALDHKDITGLHELPPLNFPVSFVAPDPEMGLSQTRTIDTGSGVQIQNQTESKGMNTGLADLEESVHEKEFCEGSSKDGHRGYSHEQHDDSDVNEQDRRRESGSDRSIAIERDITDSVSSGGMTQFTMTEPDKRSAVQSWRLALDLGLELQQSSSNVQPDHPEPDSPATHETGASTTRLTPGRSHSQPFRAQKRQNDPNKQRRKRWHARSRRACFRPRPRPASSLPATSSHVDPPNIAFNVQLPAPPAPCKLLDPSGPPSILQRARQMQRTVLRSHSDSFIRVSDSILFPARPRHSQQ